MSRENTLISDKYSAYIFDVDGTILDTAPRILESIREALRTCRLHFNPQDINSHLIGPKIAEIVDILNIQTNNETRQKLIAAFRQIYDSDPVPGTMFFPQAEKILRELRQKGKKLFIATNKPERPLIKLLKAFNLNYFTDFCTPDKYRDKVLSKAEMIAVLLEKYNLDNEKTLYVGDTRGDRDAAAQNGCPFAFAAWGYEKKKEEVMAVSDEILE